MKVLFILIFSCPVIAKTQSAPKHVEEPDLFKTEIDKNITRFIISLSTDTRLAFLGNYERQILRPVTISFNAGPAIKKGDDSTDVFGNKTSMWSVSAVASAELRYYIGLKRRIKLQQTARNFSGFYFSVEELLRSKPFLTINKHEPVPGSNSIYLNIGYQKQYRSSYIHIFFGTRFTGKNYHDKSSVLDLLHAGLGFGRVF